MQQQRTVKNTHAHTKINITKKEKGEKVLSNESDEELKLILGKKSAYRNYILKKIEYKSCKATAKHMSEKGISNPRKHLFRIWKQIYTK